MSDRISRRDFLKRAAVLSAGLAATPLLNGCAPAATPVPTQPPAAATTAPAQPTTVPQPLKGTTIKTYLEDIPFHRFVEKNKAEFEKLTGIKVEMEFAAFSVLLQQVEVELNSGSSSYDVMQNIFVKAQRWMRAGWEAPLDDYIAKSKFDTSDFITTLLNAHSWEGKQYALPYLAESTQMIYRKDVLDAAGLKPPETIDDLGTVLGKIHKPPDISGWVARTQKAGVHFPFPIWLQGYGGNVFRDPPNDLTPMLNNDAALAAVTNYTDLVLKYSSAGGQIIDTPDCLTAIQQGKAAMWVDALGLFGNLTQADKSKFADKMAIYLPPAGPKGRFPQIATHGLMMPKSSKNKDAAWEFISWALSKDMVLRSSLEAGFSAVPRKSVLSNADYAKKYSIAGVNVGDLVSKALELAKPAYRVIPEFPQVGERMGQAIGEILSKQKTVKEAMDAAQKDAVQIMTTAGYKISP